MNPAPRPDDRARLSDDVRRLIFGVLAAALIAVLAIVLATQQRPPARPPPRLPAQRVTPAPAPGPPPVLDMRGEPAGSLAPPPVESAARGFAAGYLRLIFGQGSAADITDASGALRARLRRLPTPQVPTARPQVSAVRAAPTGPGEYRVTVQVQEPTVGSFPVDLRIRRAPNGQWLVVTVESARAETPTHPRR